MKVHQKLKGLVEYNDGQFAEVQTNGTEGLEKNLLLETIQIHREDTEDTPEEFQRRFPVGTRLDIETTTEFTAKRTPTVRTIGG
jgi:hypothetical protein